jgi:phage baseplate assembly protein W
MPTFASGYATHQASEGRRFWPGLTVAFAPFLGATNDPTKMLFGRAIRPGTASFSGGRPAGTPYGWGWEFTNTTDSITCCKSNDAFPRRSGSAGNLVADCTALIGFRKTDSGDRTTDFWGTGTSLFDGTGFRRNSGTDLWFMHGGLGTTPFTPAAGFNRQDFHVWGMRGPRVPAVEAGLFLDGQAVAPYSGTSAWDVSSSNLKLGNGAEGTGGDLVVIAFFYLWNAVLAPSAIAELTADPGMLFRPVPRALARRPPAPVPPPILPSTPVIEGGDLDVVTDLPGPYFRVASGLRNIGNALARRLTTERGGLFYAPNYGLDVRRYLNAGMTPQQLAQVQGDIADEVGKDPRIENPTVTVVQNLPAMTMRITIACELAEGPFEFVIGVTSLTVQLLNAEAAS